MYKHGVYVSEQSTSIKPPVNSEGCLPFVVGVAPIHLASDPAKPNTPTLCSNYAEAVAAFGMSDDFDNYTISETVYNMFALYGVGPVIIVNVLDTSKHVTSKSNVTATVTEHEAIITEAVLYDTLVVNDDMGSSILKVNTDYVVTRMDDGSTKITLLTGEHYNAKTLSLNFQAVDPTKVTKEDIIGGIDSTTGENKGLECVNSVFPRLGMVVGMIAAPKFSADAEVAAVMAAKAESINGLWEAVALIDADTTTVRRYSDVAEWKNTNNITHASQIVCWPKTKLGDRIFNMSNTFLGAQVKLTSTNDDIPYESPSNKSAQINGLCLADGTEVVMPIENANYLNGQGIVTCLNFIAVGKYGAMKRLVIRQIRIQKTDLFHAVVCLIGISRHLSAPILVK